MNRCPTHIVAALSFGLVLPTLPAVAGDEVLSVWVGILPQVEMVERLGGDRVEVRALVRPGHSPATYEPTPKQLAELWQADLYLAIGVPFEEPLLEKLEAMDLDIRIAEVYEHVERVAIDDHHHHGGAGRPDPHIWLDPELVKVQAVTVRDHLCTSVPEHCAEFGRNLESYLEDVDTAGRRMKSTLAPFAGRDLFVFHPSFGYLARRYGLNQVAVESGGKSPSPRQLAELVERVEVSETTAIIVQPQFAHRAAQSVAEATGCELVELDPLAADHLANLERMARCISAALGG